MGKTINVSCDVCEHADVVPPTALETSTGIPQGWAALSFKLNRRLKPDEAENYITSQPGLSDVQKTEIRASASAFITHDRLLCPKCADSYEATHHLPDLAAKLPARAASSAAQPS